MKTSQERVRDGKISTGKVRRTASFSMAAAKIGLKHLGRYGKDKSGSHLNPDEHQADQLRYEHEIGQILFKALNQLKGTALKASQILSLEVDFLPKGVRDELAQACYRASPLNAALIFKVFRREFNQSPHSLFAHFEDRAFAAASLGQVHLGELKTGEHVAIKVQYPGIAASIKSDVQMIKRLLSVLTMTTDIIPDARVTDQVMEEITNQLAREVDYEQEAQNIEWFQQNLKLPNLKLPKVYPEYSSERVLVMQHMGGVHLDEWLENNPDQTIRNHYGQLLFDLFFHSIFKLGRVHADPHSGNFLFLEEKQLGLIDFGCVHEVSTLFAGKISHLYNSLILHQTTPNPDQLCQAYQNLGIIPPDLSVTNFTNELQPHLDEMQQWLIEPFLQDEFDFTMKTPFPRMDSEGAKATLPYLKSMPRDLLYFDRTYHGLLHMLKKLGACITTRNPWIGFNV